MSGIFSSPELFRPQGGNLMSYDHFNQIPLTGDSSCSQKNRFDDRPKFGDNA